MDGSKLGVQTESEVGPLEVAAPTHVGGAYSMHAIIHRKRGPATEGGGFTIATIPHRKYLHDFDRWPGTMRTSSNASGLQGFRLDTGTTGAEWRWTCVVWFRSEAAAGHQ